MCVCVGERGEWGQKTTYNPPSSLRGENQHIKQEREMMWPCGGGGLQLMFESISIIKYRPSEDPQTNTLSSEKLKG